MAHVVNISGREFPLEIGTSAGRKARVFKLRPGDVADIDDAYAVKRYPSGAEDRDPIKSIVEQISGGCVIPADDPRAASLYEAWCERNGHGSAPDPVLAPPPAAPAPRQAAAQKGR
jgi:hypothetical protein